MGKRVQVVKTENKTILVTDTVSQLKVILGATGSTGRNCPILRSIDNSGLKRHLHCEITCGFDSSHTPLNCSHF